MDSSNNLIIENRQWRVKELIENVKFNKIIKPKFQRKQRWIITPDKSKKKSPPSYSEYINFLYYTKNSVDPISFGTMITDNKQFYINIDGNNRINAIIKFVNNPLLILSKEFNEEISILVKYINKDIINNINYDEICDFRRLKDITSIIKIIDKLDREEYDKLEDIFINIQNKLLLDNKSKFTDSVILNTNIFSNGSYEDYNKIFKNINKHSNELSENELLASMLYSNIIKLEDNDINYCIMREIKSFYDERDRNEVLFNETTNFTQTINIFDFMIGLQNLLHIKNNIIPKYNSKGLGLIYKIYKILYNKKALNADSFYEFDTESFTIILVHMNNILIKIFDLIFSNRLNDRMFGSPKNITNHFKKNNLYILCITIISLINKNYDDDYIIKNLIKPVLYHILTKNIPNDDDDENTLLKDKDKFRYDAGGSYIDNLCIKIYKNDPKYIFALINKTLFRDLLKKIIFKKNNVSYETLKNRHKRRPLNFIEKIIYSIIFKQNVPIEWLDSEYSIEHIIPFSSKYENMIDLDRIGNRFPLRLDYNKKRNNKHINIYKTICPEYYDIFIKKICNTEKYDSIIVYDNNKPIIKDINLYNTMCIQNETIFMEVILNYVFNE